MPILLWIIHYTQILRAFSIILTIVAVWQFRGCARVKLIHGYGFAVICVIDSAGEICGQLNVPSNKRRNNPQNATILYSYMYISVLRKFLWLMCCTRCNTLVSFCSRSGSRYVKFSWEMRSFLGRLRVDCRQNEQTRSVSRFRRMAWRKCSSLQPHRGEKMWAESSFFWPWQRGPFALIWMGIAAMSLALPPFSELPSPRLLPAFPSSWTTHHFSLFVISRSSSYFP